VEIGPDQQAVFDGIREGRPGPVTLETEAPEEPVEGDATLRVRVEGAPDGAAAELSVEAAPPDGSAPWTERRPVEGDGARLTVPAAAWRGSRQLGVRVALLDAYGNELADASVELSAPAPEEVADPVADATVPEPAPSGGSVTDEAWFWVLIGVVAAGAIAGGVTAGVLLTSEDRYTLVPVF
jgi:hypothetical protein